MVSAGTENRCDPTQKPCIKKREKNGEFKSLDHYISFMGTDNSSFVEWT